MVQVSCLENSTVDLEHFLNNFCTDNNALKKSMIFSNQNIEIKETGAFKLEIIRHLLKHDVCQLKGIIILPLGTIKKGKKTDTARVKG